MFSHLQNYADQARLLRRPAATGEGPAHIPTLRTRMFEVNGGA